MKTIFQQIIDRELEAYILTENDQFIAFLDAFPLARGHCLIIPKMGIDSIFDLPDSVFSGLHLMAKKVALAIKIAIPCTKVGMAVVGIEVPHAHIHLIPIDSVADMNFSNPKRQFSPTEMEDTRQRIIHAMDHPAT